MCEITLAIDFVKKLFGIIVVPAFTGLGDWSFCHSLLKSIWKTDIVDRTSVKLFKTNSLSSFSVRFILKENRVARIVC